MDQERKSNFLESVTPVNFRDAFGNTHLHFAALVNHTGFIRMLIEKGADVNINTGNFTGQTPLHASAINGCLESCEVLLNSGAQASPEDDEGNTPLHIAALKKGFEKVVQLLVEKGAGINVKNRKGLTPLHLAVCHDHYDAVSVLVNAGAKVNTMDVLGNTALHFVSREALWSGTLDLLLDHGADPNVQNGQGDSPLICTASNLSIVDRLPKMKKLLQHSAKINMRNHKGRTALHFAITHIRWGREKHFDIAIVQELLQAGADPNIQDEDGHSPLHLLAIGKEVNIAVIIQLLLDHGANVNCQDHQGKTPLMMKEIKLECLQSLLDRGGDPNIPDNTGRTPLMMFSSAWDAIAFVTALLDSGANIDQVDNKGKTALMYAVICRDYSTPQMLLARGADHTIQDKKGFTVLYYALVCGRREYVHIILRLSPSIESYQTKDGKTALHLLAENFRDYSFIKELLHDVNAVDCYGCTPLHYAAWRGQAFLCTKLLQAGAQHKIKDYFGETPLQCATRTLFNPALEVLKSVSSKEEIAETTVCELEEKSAEILRDLKIYFEKCMMKVLEKYDISSQSHKGGELGNPCESLKMNSKEFLLFATTVLEKKSVGLVRFEENTESAEIKEAVENTMRQLFANIESIDPRFKSTLVPSGSVSEGTKVGLPDEFDFLVILDNFSDLCQVDESSTDFVSGLVSMKACGGHVPPDYHEFFGRETQTLLQHRVCKAFSHLVEKIVGSDNFDLPLKLYPDYPYIQCVSSSCGIAKCVRFIWRGWEFKNIFVSVDLVPTLFIRRGGQSHHAVPSSVTFNVFGKLLSSKHDFTILPPHSHSKLANMWYLSHCFEERELFKSLQKEAVQAYSLTKALLNCFDQWKSYYLKCAFMKFATENEPPDGQTRAGVLRWYTLGILDTLKTAFDVHELASVLDPNLNVLGTYPLKIDFRHEWPSIQALIEMVKLFEDVND